MSTWADHAIELDEAELRTRESVKWSRFGADVLPAWVAEMDFRTAPEVLDAIRSAVDREALGYPTDAARAAVCEACAEWQRDRYGWLIDSRDVHLAPDVLTGVRIALETCTPPGRPVIVPTPAYPPFFDVVRRAERPIVQVPMNHGRLDLARIDEALSTGARSVLLCHPHNPLGRVFDRAELAALADVVERHSARVVVDEVHAPLTYPGHPHRPYASVCAAAAEHTLTVTSASKAWNMPGLRCAQVITSNDVDRATWLALPKLATWGVSSLGLAASAAAYRSGGAWLEAVTGRLDRNRRWLAHALADELPGVRYRPPDGTYFAWLDFRALGLPTEPAEFLLDTARVAVEPGLPFAAAGQGHARLNFATSEQILGRIVQAMARSVRAYAHRPAPTAS